MKRMCKTCGRYICPPNCPEYLGKNIERGKIYGSCAECGEIIYCDDDYIRKSELIYCKVCSKIEFFERTAWQDFFNRYCKGEK